MSARRFSAALIAATSVVLATVTPVTATAQSSNNQSAAATTTPAPPASSSSSSSSSSAAKKSEPASASPSTTKVKTPEEIAEEKCQAEVQYYKKEHEQKVKDGTAGSSFMGPQELAFGIISGYGSSGMPFVPECARTKNQDGKVVPKVPFPDWAKSAESTPEMDKIFKWINIVVGVLGFVVQGVTVMAGANPEILNPLAALLRQLGVTGI